MPRQGAVQAYAKKAKRLVGSRHTIRVDLHQLQTSVVREFEYGHTVSLASIAIPLKAGDGLKKHSFR